MRARTKEHVPHCLSVPQVEHFHICLQAGSALPGVRRRLDSSCAAEVLSGVLADASSAVGLPGTTTNDLLAPTDDVRRQHAPGLGAPSQSPLILPCRLLPVRGLCCGMYGTYRTVSRG